MHGQEYFELGLMLLVGFLCAKGAQRVGQSAMVGRMIAGILIGSALAWIGSADPALLESIYPHDFSHWVSVFAGFGLTLYQCNCGTHIKKDPMGDHQRTYWAVMLSGILTPMFLGGLVGWMLYPAFSFPNIPRGVFAAMFGLCLSLTSIVAIALSLGEFGLKRSPVGTVTLKCATTEDGLAWLFLPFVLAFLPSVVSQSIGWSVLGVFGFVAFMWFGLKPALERWMPRDLSRFDVYAIYFVLLMLIAGISDALGLHALFGAMLLGMIIPRTDDFAHRFEQKIQWPIEELFVPLFLIHSGMQCSFVGFGWELIGTTVLIILTAVATKLGACTVAARFIGRKSWRESVVIGLAMNTRGLMTLMLLTVANDYGIFSKSMYTMLVLQALATTAMTSWGLHLAKARLLAKPRKEARKHRETDHGSLSEPVLT